MLLINLSFEKGKGDGIKKKRSVSGSSSSGLVNGRVVKYNKLPQQWNGDDEVKAKEWINGCYNSATA